MIAWETGVAVALWYCFSIALSSYNKYMFGENHHENRGQAQNSTMSLPLPQHSTSLPLLTTALHLLIQFLLSGGILLLWMNQRQIKDGHWKFWRNFRKKEGRYTNLDGSSGRDTQMPSHQGESSTLDLLARQDAKSARWAVSRRRKLYSSLHFHVYVYLLLLCFVCAMTMFVFVLWQ